MAKSIRSKHKRRMRAIKRERYGKKELARLKKTLGIVDNEVATDVEVEDNVLTFVLPDELKRQNAEKKKKAAEEKVAGAGIAKGEILQEDVDMALDAKKSLQEKGSYPVWMSRRAIKKLTDKRQKKLNKKSSFKSKKK